MPTNVVKTKRDEKIWNEAKQLARKQGKSESDSGFWALVMTIYQKLKSKG